MTDLDYEIDNLLPSLLRYIKRNFITDPFNPYNEMVLFFDGNTSMDFLQKLSHILNDKCFGIIPGYPYMLFQCSNGWSWYSDSQSWIRKLPTITVGVSTFGKWKD